MSSKRDVEMEARMADAECSVRLRKVAGYPSTGDWRCIGYLLREPCACGGKLVISIPPASDDYENMVLMINGTRNVTATCDACGKSVLVEKVTVPDGTMTSDTVSVPWIYERDGK